MRTCLLDPLQGYYASANSSGPGAVSEPGREVLGAQGDFITSPEISQVFGEVSIEDRSEPHPRSCADKVFRFLQLLAVYFVARWQACGSPDSLRLVELGPGKGTLLADMIRVSKNESACHR